MKTKSQRKRKVSPSGKKAVSSEVLCKERLQRVADATDKLAGYAYELACLVAQTPGNVEVQAIRIALAANLLRAAADELKSKL